MRIDVFKHFHGDAAEPQDLVNVDALNGEPSDRRVPEGVKSRPRLRGLRHQRLRRTLCRSSRWRAVKLDQAFLAHAPPAPQVREEPRRHENVRLAFLAALSARPAIERAAVDVSPRNARAGSSAAVSRASLRRALKSAATRKRATCCLKNDARSHVLFEPRDSARPTRSAAPPRLRVSQRPSRFSPFCGGSDLDDRLSTSPSRRW